MLAKRESIIAIVEKVGHGVICDESKQCEKDNERTCSVFEYSIHNAIGGECEAVNFVVPGPCIVVVLNPI